MTKLRMNAEALEVVSFETADTRAEMAAAEHANLPGATTIGCQSFRLSDCDTPCC